ncbi:hypothetical protein [Cytobacillus kochii]|uniref:hypothetical protein n=1 Tax=Cytobacillus kochii TaxID=859143 RepID=UPI0024814DDE|nr:hypothetical protein [Cytobacillus kochii]
MQKTIVANGPPIKDVAKWGDFSYNYLLLFREGSRQKNKLKGKHKDTPVSTSMPSNFVRCR